MNLLPKKILLGLQRFHVAVTPQHNAVTLLIGRDNWPDLSTDYVLRASITWDDKHEHGIVAHWHGGAQRDPWKKELITQERLLVRVPVWPHPDNARQRIKAKVTRATIELEALVPLITSLDVVLS